MPLEVRSGTDRLGPQLRRFQARAHWRTEFRGVDAYTSATVLHSMWQPAVDQSRLRDDWSRDVAQETNCIGCYCRLATRLDYFHWYKPLECYTHSAGSGRPWNNFRVRDFPTTSDPNAQS